jgi:hypothetical protein
MTSYALHFVIGYEAFHIILLPEGHFGRRRLMNNSSIVRLHREVILLSGAESCFLNNLAI